MKDFTRHPCFNKASSGSCGRVHLPVAPKCNIQCNYCNRKYDCVNESRPGVSSGVLSPLQAQEYMGKVLEKEPRITVAGIAGPGDPFANADETLETIRLLNTSHPELLYCLSSNGLNVPDHVDELADLGVRHMTITINAVNPAIGEFVYSWVRDKNVIYRGRDAAEILMERQLESVRRLKEKGVTVKVNTIILPGINDFHIPEIAEKISGLGADIMNLIPILPTNGTPFADLEEPARERVRELRAIAGKSIAQMTHCRRCRADAVGLLCHDRSNELGPVLQACSRIEPPKSDVGPRVAVVSREDMLINQHLGEAREFSIWTKDAHGVHVVEKRKAPTSGCGPKRWEDLVAVLADCKGLLVEAAGETPKRVLGENGIAVHECSGFIRDAVDGFFEGRDMSWFKARKKGVGGGCCGAGDGC